MAELECPICSADFPLSGDERRGDEVFCTYCSSPFRMLKDAKSEECELEEDF
jgi:uncharacterized Zn-finger protein